MAPRLFRLSRLVSLLFPSHELISTTQATAPLAQGDNSPPVPLPSTPQYSEAIHLQPANTNQTQAYAPSSAAPISSANEITIQEQNTDYFSYTNNNDLNRHPHLDQGRLPSMDHDLDHLRLGGVGFSSSHEIEATHDSFVDPSLNEQALKSPSPPSGFAPADLFSGLSTALSPAFAASGQKYFNTFGFDSEAAFNGHPGIAYPTSTFSSGLPPLSSFDTTKSQAEPQISSGVQDELSNMFNSFNNDLLAFPLDYAPSTTSVPDLVNAARSASSKSGSSAQEQAAELDRGLDSPLGLSPYSEFFASPLFEDAADQELPDLEPDFGPSSTSYPSLFPSPASQTPVLSPVPPLNLGASAHELPTTSLRPNPPPPSRPVVARATSSSSSSVAAAAAARAKRPKPTGFRGVDTPLVALDAPIQPRSYMTASATSRKRKTTLAERELAKRPRSESVTAEDIPADIAAAVERKRLQNTCSARRSRQRKQEHLAELEGENDALKAENERLQSRVEELERMLASVGLQA